MLYLGKACFKTKSNLYAFTRKDSAVQVNDSDTGAAMDVYYGHTRPALGIAFSPDGRFLITGSLDGTIAIRDMKHDQQDDESAKKTIQIPGNQVLSISVSPDSSRFVSACMGDYHALRIWSLPLGEQIQDLDYHSEAVYEARFSLDGLRLASAGWDKRIILWDLTLKDDRKGSLASGDKVLDGHTGEVISIDFSPDGLYLASGSYDKTIRIWDAVKGELVREITAHSDPVTSVRFLNQDIIASTSFDKTIKFWDSQLTLLETLGPYPHGIHSLAFSPDGKYTVAITREGPIAGKTPLFSS
jgi:WD40 repeat protein